MDIFEGTVHKYGDNINTDIITPGKYMEGSIEEMAKHAMEGVDPEFGRRVKPGDILVACNNFGSGSSRETAPQALKTAGISVIIAKSYARIFYRNSMNIGLPALELNAVDKIDFGDRLRVNLAEGTVENLSKGETYTFAPIPQRLLDMIRCGGLIEQLKSKM